MEFCDLLPIGSVVLLKNALKKIVIIGLMPIKHIETQNDVAYDYMGVPYPEGYIGQESAMLFNHDSIAKIIFRGYSNDERLFLVEMLQKLVENADNTIKKSKQ